MDLSKLVQLAKSNPAASKAFLNRKDVRLTPVKVGDGLSTLKKKNTTSTPRVIVKQDRVFTENQLKAIVETLVAQKVAQIPKAQDGKTPTREEIQAIITPLIPVIRQPKDGEDGKVTAEHIDEITNRILAQIAVNPDLTNAIVKVFEEGRIKAEDIAGFKELKARLDKLADNQKWINRPMGGGYTDSDVLRVLTANGYVPGGGGSSTFLALTDTPASYTSQGGKLVRVNTAEDALEFIDPPSGTGDVVGPASATNNNIALFDGTTGKLIKDSGVTTAAFAAASHPHTLLDVTDSGALAALNTVGTAQIDNNAVTFAKMQDIAADHFIGRHTAGSGDPEQVSAAQARAILGLGAVATSNDYNDLTNLPDLSALNDVAVYADLASFPATGSTDFVYIASDTGYMYRWNGSGYTQLTDQTAIWGQISGTLSDQTDLQTALNGKANTSHTHAISGVTGLQTALDLKQNILSEGAFVNGDKTKLNGIEAGAQVNTVTPTNTVTLTNKTLGTGTTNGADQDVAGFDLRDIALSGFRITTASVSGTTAINWNDGAFQEITLTGNTTLTFTAPTGDANNGWRLQLLVKQDATGGRTLALPTVKTPGGAAYTVSSGANNEDILTFYYNGTSYYLVDSKDFS